jgi:hypothetical protein
MSTSTDNLTGTSESSTLEATRPPAPERRSGRRGILGWLAVAAACVAATALAVAAFAGDDAPDHNAPPFNPQIEQIEREAHLEGNARTYGGDNAPAPAAGTDVTDTDPSNDEFVPGSRRMPM